MVAFFSTRGAVSRVVMALASFALLDCASVVTPAFVDAGASDAGPDVRDATVFTDVRDAGPVFALCDGGRCASNERLNEWTGRCESITTPYPPAGGDNGAPCESEADCRSSGHTCPIDACIWRTGPGSNGVRGGYCLSPCTLTANPWDGSTFPRSDCPAGSLCLPHPTCVSGSEGLGNCVRTGACVRECSIDADCRVEDGFYCRKTHFFNGSERTYENGYCAPSHCMSRGCIDHFACGC